MKAGLHQSTQLKQELKINPRLYQAMDLLYMPLLDLQQHLKQELLKPIPSSSMVEPEDDEDEESPEAEPVTEPTQGRRSARTRSTGRRSSSTGSKRRAAARGARREGVLRAGHRSTRVTSQTT